MRLNAENFAKTLWVGAILFVVVEIAAASYELLTLSKPDVLADLRLLLNALINSIAYGGVLAALGALICLSGEIRDQLARQE